MAAASLSALPDGRLNGWLVFVPDITASSAMRVIIDFVLV
jgi:hypothetical protein